MSDLLHNSKARDDIKMKKLIDKFGMSGYGIFWEIVSLLHREEKLSRITIARKLDVEFSKINPIIQFCLSENLLCVTGNFDEKTEFIRLAKETNIYEVEQEKQKM